MSDNFKFSQNAETIQYILNLVLKNNNIDFAEELKKIENEVENKADKTELEAALNSKVNVEKGKGLSTNDFTSEYKSRVENSAQYKGVLKSESELPTNANKGDTYKISKEITTLISKRYFMSGITYYGDIGCYNIASLDDHYKGLYTQEEYDDMIDNSSYGYFGQQILCDIYDVDWNYVCSKTIGYRDDCGCCCFGQDDGGIDDTPLSEGINYYFTRSDNNEVANTSLDTHDFYITSTGYEYYAIYNGESFDEFYTTATVDKKFVSNVGDVHFSNRVSTADSIAGVMGYYYTDINFETKQITLSKEQGITPSEPFTINYAVGDVITLNNDAKYPNCSTIVEVNNNIITVDSLPFSSKYEDSNPTPDEWNCFVIAKPLDGAVKLGLNASAFGENSQALERSSFSEGRDTVAYGQYAHVEGRNTKAGFSAHAEGRNTVASGEYSHAEGVGTTASGNRAHAEGNNSQASGLYAHAEGNSAKAQNEAAHAEGYGTVASGIYAHAEGTNTTASKESAHAEGYYTAATGDYSHSEGANTEATKMASHAEGHETTASGEASHSEGSNTTASGNRAHAEGHASIASGHNSHAEGNGTQATGTESHAEGIQTVASKTASHSEGYSTLADGEYSHAEGRNTKAYGNSAHSEGYDSQAIGESSHAEGKNTQAKGQNSHTEGENTIAEGVASHAEGKGSQATGAQAHAEGVSTKATNYAAHAEGHSTQAINEYTHAEGYGSIASGRFAHAEGRNTIANGDYQHVQGKFNKYLTDNGNPLSYAHIVGNGSSDSNRSNAHTLDWNGNAWFAGRVSAETDPVYSKDLVNKRYLDNTLRESNMVKFKDTLTEETSLPTEGNNKGDAYRIYENHINTTEKYLLSSKYIYNEWQPVNDELQSGWGFSFYEGLLADGEDMSVHIPVNIYDTSHNILGTGELYFRGEISLWVFETQTVPLTENETYYIERADGKIPTDADPTTIEEFEKVVKGYAIYNGESFDKFYNAETVDNKIAYATDLKLIKKVTLEEDVTDVNLTFDKPLSEIVFFFGGTFDTALSKGFCLRSDNGIWYMFWRTVSFNTTKRYFYAHAKEIRERLWETHVSGNFTTTLQGIADSAVGASIVISERKNTIPRYVDNLNLFTANGAVKIQAGSIIEIWGREVE